jgi:predicted RNA methylase
VKLETTEPLSQVVAGLRGLGYSEALLEVDYRFRDWFSPNVEEREVAAAAFGQTPISQETACIGVAYANGAKGVELVDSFRALGAPFILEVDNQRVCEWAVSRECGAHSLLGTYSLDKLGQLFANRAADWQPQALLRAKNIGKFHWVQQLSLFAGLLPELEAQIQEKLDPLLRSTLAATRDTYRSSTRKEPPPADLFKLVFWLLTAKVFRDRRVDGFADIAPDPDRLLAAVAKQYKTPMPPLLTPEARLAATESIWSNLDFRNLSVEVLSEIWSETLVDPETRKRLGIHRTSRSIVRYMVESVPFSVGDAEERIILEPCCGSGVFLIGAMNALVPQLFGMTAVERHAYFVKHLVGLEYDPFGVEITRLALTLADFPHPGDWQVDPIDVFVPGAMTPYLQRASAVLCNPPFHDFDPEERVDYQPKSVKKPVELLQRVLADLHPGGVLGFVLPRLFIDGNGYRDIRRQLASRYAALDVTELPDRAFEADTEVALLIATQPLAHKVCRVRHRKVEDSETAWRRFEHFHEVSADHEADLAVEQIAGSLNLPDLPDLWEFLVNYPTLEEVAELHRGIEWNIPLRSDGRETGNRATLVRSTPAPCFAPGIAPQAKFDVFEVPQRAFLNVKSELQRGNAYKLPWNRSKAIVNKSNRSRGRWRMAAFPDSEGLTCYQTFIAVWPKSRLYDEVLLSAILNSPVANAFVATREGKTDITAQTLKLIPVPHFTAEQAERLRHLVKLYQDSASFGLVANREHLLKEIDATVLSGYRMPPRLERQLLDWFRNQARPASHQFEGYGLDQFDIYFSLADHLKGLSEMQSDALLRRLAAHRRG